MNIMAYIMSYTKVKGSTKLGDFDDLTLSHVIGSTDKERLGGALWHFLLYRDHQSHWNNIKLANDEFALKKYTVKNGKKTAGRIDWGAVKKSKYWEFYKKNDVPSSVYYNQFTLKYRIPISKTKSREEIMRNIEKVE